MVVAAFLAPVAQLAHPSGEGGIVGDCAAAFAAGAKVLAWVEAEAADRANRACAPALPGRAMRLGGVLDDLQAMLRGDRHDGVHVGHATVQVDGDNGLGARRDRALDGRRVDVPGERIGIDQHWRRAGVADGRDRGDEGHGGRDHLVARADAKREQREVQRGGAGIQRHGFLGMGVGGEGFLEGIDLRAGNIGAARQRLEHCGVEFRLDAGILSA